MRIDLNSIWVCEQPRLGKAFEDLVGKIFVERFENMVPIAGGPICEPHFLAEIASGQHRLKPLVRVRDWSCRGVGNTAFSVRITK